MGAPNARPCRTVDWNLAQHDRLGVDHARLDTNSQSREFGNYRDLSLHPASSIHRHFSFHFGLAAALADDHHADLVADSHGGLRLAGLARRARDGRKIRRGLSALCRAHAEVFSALAA